MYLPTQQEMNRTVNDNRNTSDRKSQSVLSCFRSGFQDEYCTHFPVHKDATIIGVVVTQTQPIV